MENPSIIPIIDEINRHDATTLFKNNRIGGIDAILARLPKVTYVGHGVQSICFKTLDPTGFVVKCCLKRAHSILVSKERFLTVTQQLLSHNMPILPLIDILYENETWLVYTQPICRLIDSINAKICHIIIKFIAQMIESNLRISDIYYRNFGIYLNKVVMFDYHDVDTFESSSNFLSTNLYSLFTSLGHHLDWKNVRDEKVYHWDEIVSDRFGANRFPEPFVNVLVALHAKQFPPITSALDVAASYLQRRIKTQFETYRQLSLNEDGFVCINYPFHIYGIIFELIRKQRITTVLDAHSCEPGIGLKLAQDFPNIVITLGCANQQETLDTRSIIGNSLS